jgi:hypothetical protein
MLTDHHERHLVVEQRLRERTEVDAISHAPLANVGSHQSQSSAVVSRGELEVTNMQIAELSDETKQLDSAITRLSEENKQVSSAVTQLAKNSEQRNLQDSARFDHIFEALTVLTDAQSKSSCDTANIVQWEDQKSCLLQAPEREQTKSEKLVRAYGGADQCREAQEQQIPPAMIQHGHPSSAMLAAHGTNSRFAPRYQPSPIQQMDPYAYFPCVQPMNHISAGHALAPSHLYCSTTADCDGVGLNAQRETLDDLSAAPNLSYQGLPQPSHVNMRTNRQVQNPPGKDSAHYQHGYM